MPRLLIQKAGKRVGKCHGDKNRCRNDAYFWVHDTRKNIIFKACHAHSVRIAAMNFTSALGNMVDMDRRRQRTDSVAVHSFLNKVREGVRR